MNDLIDDIKAVLAERFGDIGDDVKEKLDELKAKLRAADRPAPPADETPQAP